MANEAIEETMRAVCDHFGVALEYVQDPVVSYCGFDVSVAPDGRNPREPIVGQEIDVETLRHALVALISDSLIFLAGIINQGAHPTPERVRSAVAAVAANHRP